jgi:hypothetical protein
MDNMKITSGTYVWIDIQTPGVEFEIEFAEPDGPKRVIATLTRQSSGMLFADNLVIMYGKSEADAKLLKNHLFTKKEKWQKERTGLGVRTCIADNAKLFKIWNHLVDAANSSNGAKFVEGKSIPQELF